MATISDTLKEIEKLQNEINTYEDNEFTINLMNITTVIYQDYLAHMISLDAIKSSKLKGGYLKKYNGIKSQDPNYTVWIRLNNIANIFMVWAHYEWYLREKNEKLNLKEQMNISKVFEQICNHQGISDNSVIKEEFEVIKNTRNSLHDKGKYNLKFTKKSGVLCGKVYNFLPNQVVEPLRVLDVISVMWSITK